MSEACNQSVTCEVPGHVQMQEIRGGRRFTHIKLTRAEQVRLRAERATPKEPTDA